MSNDGVDLSLVNDHLDYIGNRLADLVAIGEDLVKLARIELELKLMHLSNAELRADIETVANEAFNVNAAMKTAWIARAAQAEKEENSLS